MTTLDPDALCHELEKRGLDWADKDAAFYAYDETKKDVLAFLAQTYPELENGTWHSRVLPDGSEEITFVKVTGEKGWGKQARASYPG